MQLERDLADAKEKADLAPEIGRLREDIKALSDRVQLTEQLRMDLGRVRAQNASLVTVAKRLFLAVRSDSIQIAHMIKQCVDSMFWMRDTHKIVKERIDGHPILRFFEQLAALSPPR
jgi:hypothetical protein